MSYLVANSEDRLSRDVTQLSQWCTDTNTKFLNKNTLYERAGRASECPLTRWDLGLLVRKA